MLQCCIEGFCAVNGASSFLHILRFSPKIKFDLIDFDGHCLPNFDSVFLYIYIAVRSGTYLLVVHGFVLVRRLVGW